MILRPSKKAEEWNRLEDEKIMTYDTLNKTVQEETVSYDDKEEKQVEIDIRILGGVVAAALGIPFVLGIYTYGNGKGRNNDLRCYLQERDNMGSIIVCNGEYIINYDTTKSNFMSNDEVALLPKDMEYEYHNEINNVEYEVNYFNDKVLVLYTYSEDDQARKNVTDYIASNITIDENNVIYFNEESLSNDGFNEYVDNILYNADQGIQRTREN